MDRHNINNENPKKLSIEEQFYRQLKEGGIRQHVRLMVKKLMKIEIDAKEHAKKTN
jgi:hypothetical protein